jgi:hypothetical protein
VEKLLAEVKEQVKREQAEQNKEQAKKEEAEEEERKQKMIFEEDEQEFWKANSSPHKNEKETPKAEEPRINYNSMQTLNKKVLDPLSPISGFGTNSTFKRGATTNSVSSGSFMGVQRYEEMQGASGDKTTVVMSKSRRKKNTVIAKKKIVLK